MIYGRWTIPGMIRSSANDLWSEDLEKRKKPGDTKAYVNEVLLTRRRRLPKSKILKLVPGIVRGDADESSDHDDHLAIQN